MSGQMGICWVRYLARHRSIEILQKAELQHCLPFVETNNLQKLNYHPRLIASTEPFPTSVGSGGTRLNFPFSVYQPHLATPNLRFPPSAMNESASHAVASAPAIQVRILGERKLSILNLALLLGH
jgi:hypothetical protein